MTRTYHLSIPSVDMTGEAYRVLAAQRLFPTSSSPPPNAVPSRSAAGNSLRLRESPRVAFVDAEPHPWATMQVRGIEMAQEREAARRQEGDVETFDLGWVMQKGMSGRRVILKGLPWRAPHSVVRGFVRNMGLVEGDDAIKRLPS